MPIAKITITRPANATPYNAGDVVGATAAAFELPGLISGAELLITGVDLLIGATAVPAGMTSFRLWLYDGTPPSALADNAVWDLPSGDRASCLGYVDIGTPVDVGASLFVTTNEINRHIKAGASIFAYLQTIGGFTPAANSEVYTLTVRAVRM
jgi:hypothetical protein